MTIENPYVTATQDQRVADEVAMQGIRKRIVEAIDFTAKLRSTKTFIGDKRFLDDTSVLLDEALETLSATEARIQEGLAHNG
jgi:hypothetical protein